MNPYSFSRPVTDPAMFYGYRPELDYIISRVTSPNNPMSFAVMGGNGMGKTSLLRQAERRLRTLEIQQTEDSCLVIPLFLDMLQLDDATPGDFLGKAGHLLNRYLTKTPPSFTLPPQVKTQLECIKTHAEPADAFTDTLYDLVQAAPFSIRVVFLIDDLWRVKRQEKNKYLTGIIRALAIEPSLDKAIAYIITGSYQEGDPNKPGSPLDNLLRMVDLHTFDEEQSLALVNEPTQGKVSQEVAHRVYSETGGTRFCYRVSISISVR